MKVHGSGIEMLMAFREMIAAARGKLVAALDSLMN